MTSKPKRLLILAIICAALQFLLGAPELSDGTGTIHDVSTILQLILTAVGLAALALAAVGFATRSRSPNKPATPTRPGDVKLPD